MDGAMVNVNSSVKVTHQNSYLTISVLPAFRHLLYTKVSFVIN
jgi:hypothetical protein